MLHDRKIRLGKLGNSRVVEFAIQELTRYLKRMDQDLTVDILCAGSLQPEFRDVIWIGRDLSIASALPDVKDPAYDDAYAIGINGRSGYITGTNDRSVLLAVYRLLRELGCVWFRPGAEGERIPAKEIDEMNVQLKDAASYRHRGVCIEGAVSYENVADMIDYLPKVGMNCYFIQFLVPGTFFKRWYDHESNPLLQPEGITRDEISAMVVSLEEEIARRGLMYHKTGHGWTCEPFGIDGTSWDKSRQYMVSDEVVPFLAEINGQRGLFGNVPLNTNLCYSNPKVRQIMTDAIVEYCKVNRHVDIFHLWLADGQNNHCECDVCKSKRPADWYIMILNELDEKLNEAGLDIKVVFLIYSDLLWEPETVRLNNPDRFILMFAPIARTYGENYSDALAYQGVLPDYIRNKIIRPRSLAQNIEHLRRWQKNFDGDSFCFDYHLMWAHLSDPGYEKCAKNLFADMRDLDKLGLNGMVSCQLQRCFFPTALPFNMMATVLWNKNCDYDALADRYYSEAYGEEGENVRSCLKKISALLTMYDASARTPVVSPVCKDYDALNDVIRELSEIAQRNRNVSKEWDMLQVYVAYLPMLADVFSAVDSGDRERARVLADKMLDYLRSEELRVQKALDVLLTYNVYFYRLKDL